MNSERLLSSLMSLLFFMFVASEEDIPIEKYLGDLVEWLHSNGGMFNPKLEIRLADPSDPTSRYAMFSNDKIDQDEVLILIPPECLLTNEGAEDLDEDYFYSDMECGTIYNLLEEMELGDDSKFAPYVNYLLSQSPGQLLVAWSDSGKDLFDKVVGERLPPFEATNWTEYDTFDCGLDEYPLYEFAALLVVQRSWDNVLIPVYDMMSHRNGHWFNTKANSVHNGETVKVQASRQIEAGEEIYVSYNQCDDCGQRMNSFGTPDILCEYGFVEQYPRRWFFPYGDDLSKEVGFDLNEVKANEELKIDWFLGEPTLESINFLSEELQRLYRLAEAKSHLSKGVLESEADTIWQYHAALVEAMERAIADATGEGFEQCVNEERDCKLVQKAQ